MALVFFQAESNSRPFLDEYIENNPRCEGQEHEIICIRANQKGNGYIIETKAFITFRFKNDATMKLLMEAMDLWIEQEHGSKLVLVIALKEKGYHLLGADHEVARHWYFDPRKKSWSQEREDFGGTTANTKSNPFLPPSHQPMSTPQVESPSSQKRRNRTSAS